MPLYQVEHSCELSSRQHDQLAQALTRIHTEKFTAPFLFVNVTFTDISAQRSYVAGKRKTSNRILAHVRPGPSRTQTDYNELCASIQRAWIAIVGVPPGWTAHEKNKLHTIFILGDIVAGQEAGLALPAAGDDKHWLRDNLEVFRRRAREGEQEFVDLMGEVEGRGDLRDVLNE